jgi:hypothetical protein
MNKLFIAELTKELPSYESRRPGAYLIAAKDEQKALYYLFGTGVPKTGYLLYEIPENYRDKNQINDIEYLTK